MSRPSPVIARARSWAAGLVVACCVLVISSSAWAAAPSNDNRANATVLASAGGTLTQSTAEATKEPSEANHAGDQGGASVWFSWIPNFSGIAVINTSGSDFDTLLDVRGAGDVLLGSNDDFSASAGPSEVCFQVTSGTPVTFAVDGYLGDSGNLSLSWGE